MIGRRYWLILFKLAVTISAAVGDDDGITYVQGAGASFPNALYQDAIRVYNFVDPEVKVSYTSMGSGNGKCRITDWEDECSNDRAPYDLDFAGSDSLFSSSFYDSYSDLQMYPTVVGAVVPAFNIPALSSTDVLILSRELLVDIFLGIVNVWNDTSILNLQTNSIKRKILGMDEYEIQIEVIVREDKSGTTEVFKSALNVFSDAWASSFNETFGTIDDATSSYAVWPSNVTKADGNDGVAAAVAHTAGSVGYVVLGEALIIGLQIAGLGTGSDDYVQADESSITLALYEQGTDFGNNGDDPSRLTASLVGTTCDGAWPISAYTYLVLRKRHMRAENTIGCGDTYAYSPTDNCYGAATCAERIAMADYWEWFWSSDEVASLASNLGFVTLPDIVRDTIVNSFRAQLKCPYNTTKESYIVYNDVDTLNSATIYVSEAFEYTLNILATTYLVSDEAADISSVSYVNSSDALDIYATSDGTAAAIIASGVECSNTGSDSLCSTGSSVRLPFAAVPIGIVFNLCGVQVESECNGFETAADFYSALGTISLTIQQLGAILEGTISTWNELGTEINNPVLKHNVSGDINLQGRPIYDDAMLILQSQLVNEGYTNADGDNDFSYSSSFTFHETQELLKTKVYATKCSLGVLPLYGTIDSDLLQKVEVAGREPSIDAMLKCANSTYRQSSISFNTFSTSSNDDCYPFATLYDVILPSEANEDGCDGDKVATTLFIQWLLTTPKLVETIEANGFLLLESVDNRIQKDVINRLDEIFCNGLPVNYADFVCPPGSYYDLNNKKCAFCPLGTAASGEGFRISCTNCTAGQYAPVRGLSSCRVCTLHEYVNETGVSSCLSCPENSMRFPEVILGDDSSSFGVSIKQCLCLENYFINEQDDGSHMCLPCPGNARCEGGYSMPRPKPGYWHDTSNSDFFLANRSFLECNGFHRKKRCLGALLPDNGQTSAAKQQRYDCYSSREALESCAKSPYWSASFASIKFVQEKERREADDNKYNSGSNVTTSICRKHHQGIRCNQCEKSYFLKKKSVCRACDKEGYSDSQIILRGVGFVFCIVFSIATYIYIRSNKPRLTKKLQDIYSHVIDTGKFKVVWPQLQIIVVIDQVLDFTFPESFDWLVRSLARLVYVCSDPLEAVVPVKCISYEADYFISLLSATISALLLLSFLLLCEVAQTSIWRRGEAAERRNTTVFGDVLTENHQLQKIQGQAIRRKRKKRAYMYWFYVVTFFVYAPICNIILGTFRCDKIPSANDDNQVYYLRADDSIKCFTFNEDEERRYYTEKYKAFQAYAIIMVFIFPFGIPLIYFVALYRKRHLINPPDGKEIDEIFSDGIIIKHDSLRPLEFLYRHYRRDCWWFEVADCARRLCFTGGLLFVPEGLRGLTGLILALSCQSLYREINPYVKTKVTILSNMGHFLLVGIFLIALILQLGSGDIENNQDFGIFLSIGTLLFFMFAGYTQSQAFLSWQHRTETLASLIQALEGCCNFNDSDVAHLWSYKNARPHVAKALLTAANTCLEKVEADDGAEDYWYYFKTRLMTLRSEDGFYIFNHKIPKGVDWFPFVESTIISKLQEMRGKTDSQWSVFEDTEIQGYALKQGKLNRSWKRRYLKFVNDNGVHRLYYYESADKAMRSFFNRSIPLHMFASGFVEMNNVCEVLMKPERGLIQLTDTKLGRRWRFDFSKELDLQNPDDMKRFLEWGNILKKATNQTLERASVLPVDGDVELSEAVYHSDDSTNLNPLQDMRSRRSTSDDLESHTMESSGRNKSSTITFEEESIRKRATSMFTEVNKLAVLKDRRTTTSSFIYNPESSDEVTLDETPEILPDERKSTVKFEDSPESITYDALDMSQMNSMRYNVAVAAAAAHEISPHTSIATVAERVWQSLRDYCLRECIGARELYQCFESDNNGAVSKDEFIDTINRLEILDQETLAGFSLPAVIELMMTSARINKGGEVDYHHFVAKLGKIDLPDVDGNDDSKLGYGAPAAPTIDDRTDESSEDETSIISSEEERDYYAEEHSRETEISMDDSLSASEGFLNNLEGTNRASWGLTDLRPAAIYSVKAENTTKDQETQLVDSGSTVSSEDNTFREDNYGVRRDLTSFDSSFKNVWKALKDGRIEAMPTLFDCIKIRCSRLHADILEKQHAESVKTLAHPTWGKLLRDIKFEGNQDVSHNFLKTCGMEEVSRICDDEDFSTQVDTKVLPELIAAMAMSSHVRFEEALLRSIKGSWMSNQDSRKSLQPTFERQSSLHWGATNILNASTEGSADEVFEYVAPGEQRLTGNDFVSSSSCEPCVQMGPVKLANRIRQKVVEYTDEKGQGNFPYSQFVSDVLRATVVCYNAKDMVGVYKDLENCKDFVIVRVKNKAAKNVPPYNLHVNLLFKPDNCISEILCEVQIFEERVYDLQHRQHLAYELSRVNSVAAFLGSEDG